MWSQVWDVVSSSLIQFLYFAASGIWDNQLFLPLCLPEDIYSPFSAVLYNGNDINGKTDKQLDIRVLDVG